MIWRRTTTTLSHRHRRCRTGREKSRWSLIIIPSIIATITLIYLHWVHKKLQKITEESVPLPGFPVAHNDRAATLDLELEEPSVEPIQSHVGNKTSMQLLERNENSRIHHMGGMNSQKFKPPPGHSWEHPHQEFHANNSTQRDDVLNRLNNITLPYPILPKKVITVIGPESSGSTSLATTLAVAAGAILGNRMKGNLRAHDQPPSPPNPHIRHYHDRARTMDGQLEIQHLSLPWGFQCVELTGSEIAVNVVDALVPEECFRYELAPSLQPIVAEQKFWQKGATLEVARGPLTETEAQALQQCRDEAFISEQSNSSCGAKCGAGNYSGYALYPKRFFVNITSHIEWYLQRGVDVTVILSTRDRSISRRGKEKVHCKRQNFAQREDELAIELMKEGLRKYGAFGSIGRDRVIVSSYEALMSMKEEYLFGLYKQLGMNSTYVPSFADGNKKYVADAIQANTDKNSSTAKRDILIQQPKSAVTDDDIPKDLILPKTLITVVGLKGSGSTFLSTTLSKVLSTDSESRLQHISLPQGCDHSNLNATTVDALVLPELAASSYPGRFYLNITSHIQWHLTRGVDVKVVLVLRDKTITKKEKLRNQHCRASQEVANVEDVTAMKIMREAYQKYGGEENKVMIVSYEGLMQYKESYLFEIYNSLGIVSTYVPDFVDDNRMYVRGASLHKRGHAEVKKNKMK